MTTETSSHSWQDSNDGGQPPPISLTAPPLTFAGFRRANVARCEDAFHPLASWSEADWMTAAHGELGEAANLIKKRRRGEAIPDEEVAKELADAVTYIDLLAARMGIDLGAAVARKFNEVSLRVGSAITLPANSPEFDR